MSDVGTGIILLPGNLESSMNYKDNLYPFRQDSTFLYFFGINKPGLAGIIDADTGKETLYGENPGVEDQIWTGNSEPLSQHAALAGVTTVRSLQDLQTDVSRSIHHKQVVHYLPPYRPDQLLQISFLLMTLPNAVESGASEILIRSVIQQRSYKTEDELHEIEKAITTTVEMQKEALFWGRAGRSEATVAGKLQAIAIGAGGNLSFPTILTVNGQILHNHYSETILREGQLVLCDCGAETPMHYAGDLTRTFPVSENFSEQQLEIYDIVTSAYEAAAEQLAPGTLFKKIHLLACRRIVDGLKAIGLMKGDAEEAVNAGAHALFFPCGLGHMLGLDTHDMENLGEQYVGYTGALKQSSAFGLKSLRLGKALEQDFVITVEPGIYFNPYLIDKWFSQKKYTEFINYSSLDQYREFGGIRIENDFVITKEGSRLLGPHLPHNAAELLQLRNQLRNS